MRVDELDVPTEVVGILADEGIMELHPPQAEAVPLALEGRNLVVAIPTASGKSLIGYLPALKHVLEGRGKVLYIVPLRALASEKYDDLRRFASLGVRVRMTIGDYDSEDKGLEGADIIVATSEKADSLMRHRSGWMESISLVIADEVHLIHDPGRGPTLEVALTKLRRANPELQVIALSATIRNARELADWLEAELVASDWRPTPLKEGIYLGGVIRFTDNSTREVKELSDPVWSLVRDSVEEGGQVLVFVNTRRSTESLAKKYAPKMRKLLGRVGEEDAEAIVDGEPEPTTVGKSLATCVKGGVAFHNAGLSNVQRKQVESAFKEGRIKLIVATPTLAAGINLPARRVIVRDVYRFEGNAGMTPIPVLEVKQMCGRAGRPRFDPYGEAILLPRDESDGWFLMENYLLNEPEEIFSKLGAEPVLRSHILALIATDTATSREGVMDFLNATFFAHQAELIGLEEAVDNVLDFLRREEMVKGDDRIYSTFFGKRVSDLYIDPHSAVKLRDALRGFSRGGSVYGLLQAVCSAPDMLTMYLRRNDYEWLAEMAAEREEELLLPPPEDEGEYDFFLSEMKTACALEDWIEEREEDEILQRFNMGPGDLRNKVETADWLLYSMRELANIFNKDAYPDLTELITRMKYGVKKELLDLVRLKGVGRARARVLFAAGHRDLDSLREVDVRRLSSLPKIGPNLARSIKEQVGTPVEGPLEEKAAEEEKKEEDRSNQSSLFDF
jgi:helicase